MEYDIIEGVSGSEPPIFYTLGDLLSVLLKHQDKYVKFLGTEYTIDELMSWRGDYSTPSISYKKGVRKAKDIYDCLVADMDKVHYGYKGGEYEYYEHEEFYVANYGNIDEIAVVGYEIEGDTLVLLTKINPF